MTTENIRPCAVRNYLRGRERRDRIVAFIAKHRRVAKCGPSIREVAAAVGLSSLSTTHKHLALLREEKRVDYIDGSPRTLRVTEGEDVAEFAQSLLVWLEKKGHLLPPRERQEAGFILKRGKKLFPPESEAADG